MLHRRHPTPPLPELGKAISWFLFFQRMEYGIIRIVLPPRSFVLYCFRSRAGRQRPIPRWVKWVLRRLKVKLVDVTLRYESVGMCPLQASGSINRVFEGNGTGGAQGVRVLFFSFFAAKHERLPLLARVGVADVTRGRKNRRGCKTGGVGGGTVGALESCRAVHVVIHSNFKYPGPPHDLGSQVGRETAKGQCYDYIYTAVQMCMAGVLVPRESSFAYLHTLQLEIARLMLF